MRVSVPEKGNYKGVRLVWREVELPSDREQIQLLIDAAYQAGMEHAHKLDELNRAQRDVAARVARQRFNDMEGWREEP